MKLTNAPAQSKHSILIGATPEIIWSLITEVARWPERFGHVKAAFMEGDFCAGNSFYWKSGGVKIISNIQQSTPYQSIHWTGKAIGTNASHYWKITTQGDQTLLETSESFDGWLVRLMTQTMQNMLDKTLQEWLRDIKVLAESKK